MLGATTGATINASTTSTPSAASMPYPASFTVCGAFTVLPQSVKLGAKPSAKPNVAKESKEAIAEAGANAGAKVSDASGQKESKEKSIADSSAPVSMTGCIVQIDEVPFRIKLSTYVSTLGTMEMNGDVEQVKDETTEEKVRYLVTLNAEQYQKAMEKGMMRYLKLEKQVSTGHMVAFTPAGQLKRYESTYAILQEFIRISFTILCQTKRSSSTPFKTRSVPVE